MTQAAKAIHARNIKSIMNADNAPEAVRLLKGTYTTHKDFGSVMLLFHANGNAQLAHEMGKIAYKWLTKNGIKRVYASGAIVSILPNVA